MYTPEQVDPLRAALERLLSAVSGAPSESVDQDLLDVDPAVAAARAALAQPDGSEAAASVHSDDVAVDRFAAMLKAKLERARAKGRSGWQDPAWPAADINRQMHEHAGKGDPLDVAAFAMFLALRGERSERDAELAAANAEITRLRAALERKDRVALRACQCAYTQGIFGALHDTTEVPAACAREWDDEYAPADQPLLDIIAFAESEIPADHIADASKMVPAAPPIAALHAAIRTINAWQIHLYNSTPNSDEKNEEPAAQAVILARHALLIEEYRRLEALSRAGREVDADRYTWLKQYMQEVFDEMKPTPADAAEMIPADGAASDDDDADSLCCALAMTDLPISGYYTQLLPYVVAWTEQEREAASQWAAEFVAVANDHGGKAPAKPACVEALCAALKTPAARAALEPVRKEPRP